MGYPDQGREVREGKLHSLKLLVDHGYPDSDDYQNPDPRDHGKESRGESGGVNKRGCYSRRNRREKRKSDYDQDEAHKELAKVSPGASSFKEVHVCSCFSLKNSIKGEWSTGPLMHIAHREKYGTD